MLQCVHILLGTSQLCVHVCVQTTENCLNQQMLISVECIKKTNCIATGAEGRTGRSSSTVCLAQCKSTSAGIFSFLRAVNISGVRIVLVEESFISYHQKLVFFFF